MALAAGGCQSNCSARPGLLEAYDELWAPWIILTDYFEYQPWLFSLIGSAMVGLSGVFPLLVIPIDEAADLKHGGETAPPILCIFTPRMYTVKNVV